MSILDIFKPAPHIEEIKDKKEIKKKYFYWRIRTFYTMYIGYAFFYFSRKSFTFAMPAMIQEFGFSKAQLGMLASILSLTYGASKFVSGIISDRSNPRYFMAIGLILTGIINIFFGLSSTLLMFAILWGLNGWFQGWGWPPAAKLLTHWYSQSERGAWWSMWNTSHNLGGAVIPLVVTSCIKYGGWRYGLYVPGILCIIVGLFVINRLRDTPQSLGLPPIEKYKNDFEAAKVADNQKLELTTREILVGYVLKNKYIWLLAFSYFFIYIIRTAVNDWTTVFLVEQKGFSFFKAGSTFVWFEIGGFCGSLAAGWSSDWLFKGKRGPVNVIFTALAAVAIFAMWKYSGTWMPIESALIFLVGFAIFGPQMLVGVAAAELSHKKAAGTATGFAGWFAYVGAAVAGGPLGKLMQKEGWEGYFLTLAICCLVAFVLLLPLWNVRVNPHHVED